MVCDCTLISHVAFRIHHSVEQFRILESDDGLRADSVLFLAVFPEQTVISDAEIQSSLTDKRKPNIERKAIIH